MKEDILSIVVPSYNGASKLPSFLSHLESQTLNGFEVIIIVDGSIDNSVSYLDEYVSENFRLNYHYQKNKGRAASRNAGAEVAKGELLIFLDDDMHATPNLVERHLRFQNHYKDTILGGNQIEQIALASNDFDKYRCYIREKWNCSFKELEKLNYDNLHLTAANFSINRSLFLKLKGFDERLNDAEDIQFAHKALSLEVPIYFDPELVAWHQDFVGITKYIKRRRQYFEAYNQLRVLEGDQEWIIKRTIKMNSLKKAILNLFSHRIILRLIEKEKISFLPQKLRYRLYSIVVTGLSTVYLNRKID